MAIHRIGGLGHMALIVSPSEIPTQPLLSANFLERTGGTHFVFDSHICLVYRRKWSDLNPETVKFVWFLSR